MACVALLIGSAVQSRVGENESMRITMAVYLALASVLFVNPRAGLAETFFVATDGSDDYAGTLEKPFATIQHAQKHVAPGDTVYIRGGTYKIEESQIAMKRRIWAYVILLNKSGTADKRINYWAYPNEQPIFDFSAVKPNGLRVHAFEVTGSWIHIKGIEVVGVQVTIKRHTQSICFSNNGSHNIYEQLSMHDGQAIGIYSVRGKHNLFLNCDAYRNHDFTSEDGKGDNVDGFGCHPGKGDVGNVFEGCRAWFNSDDGFDCINAAEAVTFKNCWAFYNGYSPKFRSLRDGNGFKAGGHAGTPVRNLPRPIPRHIVQNCLAVRNRASGFYANHHIGGCDWIANSAFGNGSNFNMLNRLTDNRTDVPGYGHKLHGNLSYGSRSRITNIDFAKCDCDNNSFTLDSKLRKEDFKSLDEEQLVQPRQANGSLPATSFLVPVRESVAIGIGFTQNIDRK